MDLKPSNVLIDTQNNALLCDMSGIAGTTWDYLAPEMRDIQDPLAESKQKRERKEI